MSFQRKLQSSIDSRPYLNKFIISTRGKQEAITAETNTSYTSIVSLNECYFFGFSIEIYLPEFQRLITAGWD
jgi:hypothetical protein